MGWLGRCGGLRSDCGAISDIYENSQLHLKWRKQVGVQAG